MCALEREHVGRLLDDANHRAVTPHIPADLAGLFLRPVAALAAEPNSLLRVAQGAGELERLVLGCTEEMKRKPVGSAGAHPGQARQLGDEVFDRRAEHAAIVPVCIGPALPPRPAATTVRWKL